jgi:hypothetical protein
MLQDPLSLALGPFRKDSQGKRPCECAVKALYPWPLTSKPALSCHGGSPPKGKGLTVSTVETP